MSQMLGVRLPGNSTVEFRHRPIPEPGHGQVLLKMKASSICGSDIRAIYREHLGKGPEGYQGVIAGHEPCGQVVEVGPGCKRLQEGDRVVSLPHLRLRRLRRVPHGYMISCTDAVAGGVRLAARRRPRGVPAAEENTCIRLPDSLSYVDGALVSCGFGTAYEALRRMQVSAARTAC